MKTLVTFEDLARMAHHPEYAGWGYLGHPNRTHITDRALLGVAKARCWDFDQVFGFVNSKLGRWCGDELGAQVHAVDIIMRYMSQYGFEWI